MDVNDGPSDSEDEDDLNDVPDTREYTPLDMEGLQAMGIGGKLPGGGSGGDEGYTLEDLQNMTMNNNDLDDDEDEEDDEEDADDIDDIRIRDQDALILVAKTE